MFETLKVWFDVGDRVSLDLSDIDAAVSELGEPVMIAALAMRKLQALRLLSTPGVKTSTDVVVSIVQDLDRALIQAPTMYLERAVEQADWDAAFEEMVDAGDSGDAPESPDDEDAEVTRFRELHRHLHEAVRAVLVASDGEIRFLE